MPRGPDPGEAEGAKRLLDLHGPRLAAEARAAIDADRRNRPAGLIVTAEARRSGTVHLEAVSGDSDVLSTPLDQEIAVLVTRANLREGFTAQKRPELLSWLAMLEENRPDHLPIMVMTRNGLMCGAFEMPAKESDAGET